MKNCELLDRIGDVNEDYVLEAGSSVVKPRFPWKTLAVCAACAALVVCAYPAFRFGNQFDSAGITSDECAPEEEEAALHAYTVVEGGAQDTQGVLKAPGGGESTEEGAPVGAWSSGTANDGGGEESFDDADGWEYSVPNMDGAVDEEAASQYAGLLRGLGGQDGFEPDAYPDWFAGAWIDHGGAPDAPAQLAVAIVDGLRTPELEAQILDWCGGTGEILFIGAKYSYEHLNGLMEPVVQALDGTGFSSGVGVDVTANCLGLDIYSGGTVPDWVLAELARLDPEGDAIRVQVYTGTLGAYDGAEKGPAPDEGDG